MLKVKVIEINEERKQETSSIVSDAGFFSGNSKINRPKSPVDRFLATVDAMEKKFNAEENLRKSSKKSS